MIGKYRKKLCDLQIRLKSSGGLNTTSYYNTILNTFKEYDLEAKIA
jgi:hypothetical protein